MLIYVAKRPQYTDFLKLTLQDLLDIKRFKSHSFFNCLRKNVKMLKKKLNAIPVQKTTLFNSMS